MAVSMYLSIEEGENAFLALVRELGEDAIQCNGEEYGPLGGDTTLGVFVNFIPFIYLSFLDFSRRKPQRSGFKCKYWEMILGNTSGEWESKLMKERPIKDELSGMLQLWTMAAPLLGRSGSQCRPYMTNQLT